MKTAEKIRKFIIRDLEKESYTNQEATEDVSTANIKLYIEYSNGVVDVYDVLENKMKFNKTEGKKLE